MLNNLFDYLNNSGRYFLSFWGPMKTDSKHQKDYIIDIFDRSTQTKGQYSIHHYVAIITEPFSSSSPFRAARQAGYCAGCVRVGHRLALLSFSSYGRGKMGERRIFFLPGSLMVTPIYNPHALHNHPPLPPSQQFRW